MRNRPHSNLILAAASKRREENDMKNVRLISQQWEVRDARNQLEVAVSRLVLIVVMTAIIIPTAVRTFSAFWVTIVAVATVVGLVTGALWVIKTRRAWLSACQEYRQLEAKEKAAEERKAREAAEHARRMAIERVESLDAVSGKKGELYAKNCRLGDLIPGAYGWRIELRDCTAVFSYSLSGPMMRGRECYMLDDVSESSIVDNLILATNDAPSPNMRYTRAEVTVDGNIGHLRSSVELA